MSTTNNQNDANNANGNQQRDENGQGQQPPAPLKFDEWMGAQPKEVQELLTGHTSGLQNSVKAARDERDAFAKQLKTLSKAADEGSELKKQLDDALSKLGEANRKDAFTAGAVKANVNDVRLAFLAAHDAGLVDEKGNCNFEDLKKVFPQLFASAQQSPPPPRGNAGAGAGQNGGGQFSMNTFIRRAAGRAG